MALEEFVAAPGGGSHPFYEGSVLWPVAPEWTTGEVLIGAAYRKLILGISETTVDRDRIQTLPKDLPQGQPWEDLLLGPGGLSSPALGREQKQSQLMPLVPEIARYACVLGRLRGRWDPSNLLLTTIAAGVPAGAADELMGRLRDALLVETGDDLVARFIESELASLDPKRDASASLSFRAPAWRTRNAGPRVPSERFAEDLEYVISLKSELTRRQWTVLLEALLRLGLATHMLWLCRLNVCIWKLVIDAVEEARVPTAESIEQLGWTGHDSNDPLLELGRDANAAIKNRIQSYVQARIGLNLLLHALDAAGCGWPTLIGESAGETPSAALAAFVRHVGDNAAALPGALRSVGANASLRLAANTLTDSNPRLLSQVTGFAKNLLEFIRYTLIQMQTQKDEQKAYDQGYLVYRKSRVTHIVQPGPATLIMLVHACCRALGEAPASLDDFKLHLAHYGLRAPAGELQLGQTSRDLERLGLVVDSPDAGGGRLLVDPF